MVSKIQKRDGRVVAFDRSKIFNAISKANREVSPSEQMSDTFINEIVDKICRDCEETNIPNVEDVQDMVETSLMKNGSYSVAKNYIRYRYKHKLDRERHADLMKKVGEKIRATNVENQNANVDEVSFGGRKGEADSVLMKQWALENCISKMARENHENNEIYIHDLDSYAVGSHNCLTIPFDNLLENGFNTRQTDVRPAQSVNTAFQLVAVLFQLQSLQQFGGVSASHLDWTMVPYVRKSFYKHYRDGLHYVCKNAGWKGFVLKNPEDITIERGDSPSEWYRDDDAYEYAMEMTVKEINQAVEGMYHNLNTLQSRSGNQLNELWLLCW